jgi:hypothetical protein
MAISTGLGRVQDIPKIACFAGPEKTEIKFRHRFGKLAFISRSNRSHKLRDNADCIDFVCLKFSMFASAQTCFGNVRNCEESLSLGSMD